MHILAFHAQAMQHRGDPAIWITGIVYFVVVAAIGVWATRRTRTAKDFFVAGEGIGVWPTALASMSAAISGFAFIGGPGLVYQTGMSAMFIMLPAALTGAMSAWVLAKRMRLLGEFRGLVTIPDAIGVRYRSPAAQGLSGIAILIAVIGYMATQILALGIVIDAIFGTGLTVGIWIGTAITLAYSVAGGILAGVYTDVFQGTLMAVASVLVFMVTLQVGGGLSGISRTLLASSQPALLSPWGTLGPIAALSLFFVFGMGSLGQPHVIHKFYMIRDPRKLKWLPLMVTSAIMLTMLLYYGVGAAMRALTESGQMVSLIRTPDRVTPTFLLERAPLLLAGIVFSGVAAAIMSTVNSFMNIGAAVMTYDLPKALGRTPSNALSSGRVWTIAISLAAALIAQMSGALVVFLGLFGWGLFASTIVPSLAIGLNWHGATREGAIASILTGLVTTLTLETLRFDRIGAITLPAGVSPSGIALILSLLVFFTVSWLTRHRPQNMDPIVRLVMDA
ncbi:MAG: sodium/proline symporter [Longimicrobiales bacterium]